MTDTGKKILKAFYEGKSPNDLIKKSQGGKAEIGYNRKTVYSYHKKYQKIKSLLDSLLDVLIER